jgi:hypothetical protein
MIVQTLTGDPLLFYPIKPGEASFARPTASRKLNGGAALMDFRCEVYYEQRRRGCIFFFPGGRISPSAPLAGRLVRGARTILGCLQKIRCNGGTKAC